MRRAKSGRDKMNETCRGTPGSPRASFTKGGAFGEMLERARATKTASFAVVFLQQLPPIGAATPFCQ
jgi:hypothetical protein